MRSVAPHLRQTSGAANFDLNQGRTAQLHFRWYRFAYWPGALPMLDVIMLAIGFISFAASIAYVYACDQL
jgi:hypothetical protein